MAPVRSVILWWCCSWWFHRPGYWALAVRGVGLKPRIKCWSILRLYISKSRKKKPAKSGLFLCVRRAEVVRCTCHKIHLDAFFTEICPVAVKRGALFYRDGHWWTVAVSSNILFHVTQLDVGFCRGYVNAAARNNVRMIRMCWKIKANWVAANLSYASLLEIFCNCMIFPNTSSGYFRIKNTSTWALKRLGRWWFFEDWITFPFLWRLKNDAATSKCMDTVVKRYF